MARPLRIEYPGAWYHITCRGNERRAIYDDNNDRRTFLDILATSIELFNAELHAYILMDNHFHLILKTREANLSRLMQRFNTSYTVYFNRRHGRSGHLYQGRYKAILVDADAYLLELSRYIHLNPARVKKYSQLSEKEKIELIENYPWSSYRGYVRKASRQHYVTYNLILSMIGDDEHQQDRREYRRFAVAGLIEDTGDAMWEELTGGAILGPKKFLDNILETITSQGKSNTWEYKTVRGMITGPDSVEAIARVVADVFGVPEASLYKNRSVHRDARSILMELSRFYLSGKMSLTEMVKKLGGIGISALSQNRKRLMARIESDKELKGRFEEARKNLSQ